MKENTRDKHIQDEKKAWVIFEYHNPIIRKVSNIFRNSNLKIAYRTSNKTQTILKQNRDTNDMYTNSGIYSLQCKTCQKHYIGQTGHSLKARVLEHHRYIRSNEPKSAYAQHILVHGHEYGPLDETMTLVKTCKKGRCMNILEQYFIQSYRKLETLIEEQHPIEDYLILSFLHTHHSTGIKARYVHNTQISRQTDVTHPDTAPQLTNTGRSRNNYNAFFKCINTYLL